MAASKQEEAELKHYLEIALDIAKKAGAIINDAFHKEKSIMTKGCSTDMVTETDQNVEKLIIGSLRETFPTHSFIGEESVAAGEHCVLTENPTWIIDPIDGTTNFVHRYPYVCVSIGLAINKEVVVGLIYNSVLEEMYTAIKGQGAYCNGKKMMATTITDLNKALIITEVGSDRSDDRLPIVMSNLHKIIKQPNAAHSVRLQGSAAMNLCTVARGSAEAYYEFGIHCWDIAAGMLILTESGGTVLDPSGGPVDMMSRRIVAGCTPELTNTICKLLDIVEFPRD